MLFVPVLLAAAGAYIYGELMTPSVANAPALGGEIYSGPSVYEKGLNMLSGAVIGSSLATGGLRSAGSEIVEEATGVPTSGKVSPKGAESITQVNPRNLIPTQTRSEMSGSQVKRLEKSMKINGYDQSKPIEATRRADGRLEIQDGHHRAEAAKNAGLDKVPVKILGE